MEQNRCISLLGSTGSIGRQSLDVIAACGMRVAALTANRDVEQMEKQCRRFQPELAVMMDPEAAASLRLRLADTPIRVAEGMEGLLKAARGYAESSNRALPPDDGAVLLPVGQRVRHFVFGLGRVLDVDLNRGAHLVQFDDMETPRRISFRAKLEAWPEDAPSTGERQNSDYE